MLSETGVLNVHLISGEDIIGDVSLSHDGSKIVVSVPLIPVVRQADGRVNIQLVPFRPWMSDLKKIELDHTAVLFTAPLDKGLEDVYRQNTSIVQLADASSLMATVGSGSTLGAQQKKPLLRQI